MSKIIPITSYCCNDCHDGKKEIHSYHYYRYINQIVCFAFCSNHITKFKSGVGFFIDRRITYDKFKEIEFLK